MRTIAVALLACTGCNLVLGLRDTRQVDAAPPAPDAPPDAAWPTLTLERQVLVAPDAALVTSWAGADTPPMVQVGLIGGALVTAPIDTAGHFLVPADLLSAPYRIVYQLPGDVPTEIQWSGTTGTFAVPLLGRADHVLPPGNTQLQFAPTGAPASIPDARMLTSGRWTIAVSLGTVSSPFSLHYPDNSQSLSGPAGDLNGTLGDVEVLTACGDSGNPGAATAFAVMKIDHLVANATVTAPSTWTTPTTSESVPVSYTESPLGTRLDNQLGALAGGIDSLHEAGALPTTNLAPFETEIPGDLDLPALLPLYIAQSAIAPLRFVDPFNGAHAPAPGLPLAVFGRVTTSRTALGARLTSGIEQIDTLRTPQNTVNYEVGLPGQVLLGNVPLTGSTAVDGVKITASGSTIPLQFQVDRTVDDCMVTVYSIASAELTPVRRYLVTQAPSAQAPMLVDRSVFAPDTDYALAITCRRGSRVMSDFTAISFPYLEATTYPATFRVQ